MINNDPSRKISTLVTATLSVASIVIITEPVTVEFVTGEVIDAVGLVSS